jgi:hypothetical protein
MSSSFRVVDIPALTKLTWDLHNQCHAVVKHAPDGFRKLVTELGTLQGTLRTFGDDMSSHASFFEKMDKDRIKQSLINQRFGLNSCNLARRKKEIGILHTSW